mmetsp:Transcript_53880/g.174054  ORF Transcript_53880/g.174054 Transcript_53880/m.174054 type:complete len:210 (-) Transcript_53880:2466-3095(-)
MVMHSHICEGMQTFRIEGRAKVVALERACGQRRTRWPTKRPGKRAPRLETSSRDKPKWRPHRPRLSRQAQEGPYVRKTPAALWHTLCVRARKVGRAWSGRSLKRAFVLDPAQIVDVFNLVQVCNEVGSVELRVEGCGVFETIRNVLKGLRVQGRELHVGDGGQRALVRPARPEHSLGDALLLVDQDRLAWGPRVLAGALDHEEHLGMRR